MRVLRHPARNLVLPIIVTILPLFSLMAQEPVKLDLKPYFDKASEEVPDKPKPQPVKQHKPTKPKTQPSTKTAAKDLRTPPKARFVSTKRYLDRSIKIQLGYFKNKKNVFNLVHKIKKDHDLSVYVKTENKNSTDRYRVMIIDITSKQAAKQILKKLNAEGFKGVIL